MEGKNHEHRTYCYPGGRGARFGRWCGQLGLPVEAASGYSRRQTTFVPTGGAGRVTASRPAYRVPGAAWLICVVMTLALSAPVAVAGAHNLHLPTLPTLPTLDTYRYEPSPGFQQLRNRALNPQRPRRTFEIPSLRQPLQQRSKRWTGQQRFTEPPTFEMPSTRFTQPPTYTYEPAPPSMPTWRPMAPPSHVQPTPAPQDDWRSLVDSILQPERDARERMQRQHDRQNRAEERNFYQSCAKYNRWCANMLRSLGR